MKPSFLLLSGALCASISWVHAQETVNVPAVNVPTADAPRFAVPVVPVQAVPAPTPKAVPSGLAPILNAKFPLSIGFSDLGAGWRVLEYSSYDGNLYFTQGDTHFVNDTEFLVAYKRVFEKVSTLSPREYALYVTRQTFRTGNGERYRITLLPMRGVANLITGGSTQIRSFSADEFRLASQIPTSEAFEQNLSLVYLRKIGEAIRGYRNANLSVLPPMDSAALARESLEEFAENPAIWTQPGTARPFAFNPLFSGRKMAHLRGKGSWVLAYEAAPARDGSRAVLRLDGRVLRLSEKQAQKLLEISRVG